MAEKKGKFKLGTTLDELLAQRKDPKNSAYRSEISKAISEARKTQGGEDTGQTESTSPRTAEEVNRIAGAAKAFGDNLAGQYLPAGTFGTLQEGTTPEMRAYLARLNDFANTAGQYTNLENEAIGALRAGLSGYSSPELQAQREAAAAGINQDLRTQLRMQALVNARNRVRGASAGAGALQLQEGAQRARGALERDLFVKNADEIQRRKEAFSNTVNQTETARFGRKQTAEQLYGQQLSGEEAYQGALRQYNNAQRQNEVLARANLGLSGAGVYTGLYGGEQGAEIARANLEQTRKSQEDYQAATMKQLEIMRQSLSNRNQSTAV